MTAAATGMTLDHTMWWVQAGPSPLTGDSSAWYFEWNVADSQTECIARAPGEEWNNEDDVEYTRTGWLTYEANGDICAELQERGLPCDNLASPSDLTRTQHQIWAPDVGAEGCMVNLSSAVGVMAGGQSPEDSASLAYAFEQTWPLITDDGEYYGEMIIEASIVATSGDNPPPLPWPLFPSDPPDYDGDGDVDLEDYGHFEDCATGPEVGLAAIECEDADFDQDGDVDQADFGVFQGCISGNGNDLDPDCVK